MSFWLRAQDYGRTTLSEAVDADDTTLLAPLADHGRFPAANAGDNNFIITLWDSSSYRTPLEAFEADDLEQVLVNSNDIGLDPETFEPIITSMIVTRGYGGTTPQAWPAGTAMWLCDNAAVIAELQAALDAHTHTGAATQQTGAAIPITNITGMSTYNLTALTVKGTTYVHAGEYIKAYTDGTALYAGSTGGVLDLQQGTAAAGKSRSRVLQWCRDGISGGVQVAFAPVHDDANAYFRFVIFPKGSHADGAGFTVFGDGAATYYSNWYQTSADAGIAVRNNINTLNFRNGHQPASDTIAFGFGLNTSLITFRSDVIAGRGAADRYDIGTAAAPDNLKVWGNTEHVGSTTLTALSTNGLLQTTGGTGLVSVNTAVQAAVNAMMLQSREWLVEELIAIAGTASNVKGLWLFDPVTGTTMVDYSGQSHNATLSVDASTMTPTVSGLKRSLRCSASALWSAGDDDDFSLNGPTACTMIWFGRLQDATASTLLAKYDNTTGSTALEYQWTLDESDKMRVRFYSKNLVGTYIGRSYNTALTADQNTWKCYTCTYDGGTASSGVKLWRDTVQIDDTDQVGGVYTGPNNTTAVMGGYCRTADGSVVNPCKGDVALVMFIKGEVWTSTQIARVCLLLNNVAATGVGQA